MIFAPFAFKNKRVVNITDPNAQAFITAAGITDETQQIAINQLVLDLKSNSLWTKMYLLYPFVGGTSTTTKYNLMNPVDSDAAYRMTWNGGITFDSNGVQSNGSTGYGNPHFNPNTFNSTTAITSSNHFAVYSRTNVSNDNTDYGSAVVSVALQMLARRASGNMLADNYAELLRAEGSVPNSQGLFVSTRTSLSSHIIYRNGSSVASNTSTETAAAMNSLIYDLTFMVQNYIGSLYDYSNRQYAWFSIGSGLNATDSTNLYTVVQAYQTALGRQV